MPERALQRAGHDISVRGEAAEAAARSTPLGVKRYAARVRHRPTPRPASPRPPTAAHPTSKGPPPAPPAASSAAFQLPLIPKELELSPLVLALLQLASFLDLSEEPVVDARASGQTLARMGLYMQRLDDESVESLADDLDALAEHAKSAGWPEEALEFIQSFLENCGFVPEDEPAPPNPRGPRR